MADEETNEEVEEEEEEKKEKKGDGISLTRILVIVVGGALFFGAAYSVSHFRGLTRNLDDNIRINTGEILQLAKEADDSALKAAVLDRVGLSEEEADYEVTENTGTHAKGNINEADAETGGGYWLAANTEDGWVAVFDGQANPTCEEIGPYSFPTDLVEECLDEEGEVVTRE